MRKIDFKSQTGAVTAYTMVVLTVVSIILIGLYFRTVNKQRADLEVSQEIKAIYEKDVNNVDEVYNNLINNTTTGFVGGQYNETKGVNTPKIVDGLIPVTIKVDGKPNIVENPNTDNWYSYTTTDKRWANAITTEDGTKTGKVTGYWVWIPRYAYQITSMYHTEGTGGGEVSIKFLKGTTTDTADGTTIHTSGYDINGTNTSNAYFLHPAFQDGRSTGYKNGEWDKELAGFWVAKFPAGYAGGNNDVEVVGTGLKYTKSTASSNLYGVITLETESPGSGTEMKYPVFLPETYAYNYIAIGDSFNLVQNLGKGGNIYGLKANANSHQMKNSEWGAVAYLTQSAYGINGNIYINNINLNNTIYVNNAESGTLANIHAVTGWVGEGTDTASNTVSIAALNDRTQTGANVWYSSGGQKGSSTGNIYGIYDLSGCVWERVSAYINNGNGSLVSNGGVLVQATSDKLRTVYSNNASDTLSTNYNENSTKYGDAMYETSNVTSDSTTTASWYSDYSDFMYLTGSFVVRGSNYSYGASANAGVFAFYRGNGGNYNDNGFRAVLSPI